MREAGLVMVRYADDAVVLCRNREEAEAALTRMRAWVTDNGLMLHPDKTHVGDCRMEGQGFEFLGYRFEAGKRWVRKKSLMSLRDRVRAKTKRNEGNSIEYVIAFLNSTLRGWYNYFQHAYWRTFSSIDGFVHRRLRAMLCRQKYRPGQGRCLGDHKQWPNIFFADLGLFEMFEAHTLACQSRRGNNRLESPSRENRTPGSGGGAGYQPVPTPIVMLAVSGSTSLGRLCVNANRWMDAFARDDSPLQCKCGHCLIRRPRPAVTGRESVATPFFAPPLRA